LHRDIKPHNVVISRCLSDLRLIDFNVAACLDEGPALTPTGTEQCKAPELILGETHSTRSDVWASAMCIYFLLSGFLPQRRSSLDAFARVDETVALEPVSFNSACWHDVSDEFKAMLRRCLAIQCDERPEMAEVLLDDSWTGSHSLHKAVDESWMPGSYLSLMKCIPALGTEAVLSVLPYAWRMLSLVK